MGYQPNVAGQIISFFWTDRIYNCNTKIGNRPSGLDGFEKISLIARGRVGVAIFKCDKDDTTKIVTGEKIKVATAVTCVGPVINRRAIME